ncbi:hypothetical protein EVAR_27242_1 [Eumeta japonica]|uniref:Uncharacterized protein n=1 Tax=Eumeta variegata TaxID=151549 RepID=A0A4C1W2D2_EUMVA|nr:hypothetical protein EVAR_27242_1 [Eumeta japonica]
MSLMYLFSVTALKRGGIKIILKLPSPQAIHVAYRIKIPLCRHSQILSQGLRLNDKRRGELLGTESALFVANVGVGVARYHYSCRVNDPPATIYRLNENNAHQIRSLRRMGVIWKY